TSPVTLGLGYLIDYPWLVATFWGVPLAHALIAFPFVTRTLLPALRALPAGQVRAAATLGAGPWRTLWRVELPQLLPSLAVATAFAFAVSLGEFGASLLLLRPELATLPVAIYDRLGRPGAANYGAALGLALVLMAVTALVQWLALRPVDGLTLLTITVFVALAMLLLPPAVYDRVAAAWRPRFSSGSGMGSAL
ncbi:MAG: ABC transporter permease subunit, partial [Limnochordales bacterium]